jgi:hypothetical protein
MLVNVDRMDVPAIRAAMKAKFSNLPSMIDRWSDERIVSYALVEKLGIPAVGLEQVALAAEKVIIEVSTDSSLDRAQIVKLMSLKIVYKNTRFAFSDLVCDKEMTNDGWGSAEYARAWMEFRYLPEA